MILNSFFILRKFFKWDISFCCRLLACLLLRNLPIKSNSGNFSTLFPRKINHWMHCAMTVVSHKPDQMTTIRWILFSLPEISCCRDPNSSLSLESPSIQECFIKEIFFSTPCLFNVEGNWSKMVVYGVEKCFFLLQTWAGHRYKQTQE